MAEPIYSMTGFGNGSAEDATLRVRAVLRSVNGRFLDLQIRCPSSLQDLEPRIRERLQARLRRGKVTGNVEFEQDTQKSSLPQLNNEVAAQYVVELRRLAQLAGTDDDTPSLEALVRLPGLFSTEAPTPDLEALGELVLQAVEEAAVDLERMREREAATLVIDLRQRIARLDELIAQISVWAEGERERLRERLRERVEGLLRPGEIEADRLTTEIVLIADRGDITEEIVRFRSHTEQFMLALDEGGEVGRRLNFLLQELHREINTISSKAASGDIIHGAVDAKEEIERLREQVQNLA